MMIDEFRRDEKKVVEVLLTKCTFRERGLPKARESRGTSVAGGLARIAVFHNTAGSHQQQILRVGVPLYLPPPWRGSLANTW